MISEQNARSSKQNKTPDLVIGPGPNVYENGHQNVLGTLHTQFYHAVYNQARVVNTTADNLFTRQENSYVEYAVLNCNQEGF